jgi:hypothetical protein
MNSIPGSFLTGIMMINAVIRKSTPFIFLPRQPDEAFTRIKLKLIPLNIYMTAIIASIKVPPHRDYVEYLLNLSVNKKAYTSLKTALSESMICPN